MEEVDPFSLSRVAGQAEANGNQDRCHGFSLLDLDIVRDRSGDFHGIVEEVQAGRETRRGLVLGGEGARIRVLATHAHESNPIKSPNVAGRT